MNDAVSKPSHYMLFADGTEAIDVIRSALTPEEFIGYCKGNVLKYRLRAGKKDKLEQDIAKAETYAKMLEEQVAIVKAVDNFVTAYPPTPEGLQLQPFTLNVDEDDYECKDCATCMNLNCPRR